MTDKHPEWMGKNRKLTPVEVNEFLAEPVVARIATIDENGVPYVTPVWQEWDGGAFWIVPRERAAWIAHIKNNPNVGISCAQDSGTHRRITAQGKAEIVFVRRSDAGPVPRRRQSHGAAFPRRARTGISGADSRPPPALSSSRSVPTKMLTWDGVWNGLGNIPRNCSLLVAAPMDQHQSQDRPDCMEELRGLCHAYRAPTDGSIWNVSSRTCSVPARAAELAGVAQPPARRWRARRPRARAACSPAIRAASPCCSDAASSR